jgi:hypothetical protein
MGGAGGERWKAGPGQRDGRDPTAGGEVGCAELLSTVALAPQSPRDRDPDEGSSQGDSSAVWDLAAETQEPRSTGSAHTLALQILGSGLRGPFSQPRRVESAPCAVVEGDGSWLSIKLPAAAASKDVRWRSQSSLPGEDSKLSSPTAAPTSAGALPMAAPASASSPVVASPTVAPAPVNSPVGASPSAEDNTSVQQQLDRQAEEAATRQALAAVRTKVLCAWEQRAGGMRALQRMLLDEDPRKALAVYQTLLEPALNVAALLVAKLKPDSAIGAAPAPAASVAGESVVPAAAPPASVGGGAAVPPPPSDKCPVPALVSKFRLQLEESTAGARPCYDPGATPAAALLALLLTHGEEGTVREDLSWVLEPIVRYLQQVCGDGVGPSLESFAPQSRSGSRLLRMLLPRAPGRQVVHSISTASLSAVPLALSPAPSPAPSPMHSPVPSPAPNTAGSGLGPMSQADPLRLGSGRHGVVYAVAALGSAAPIFAEKRVTLDSSSGGLVAKLRRCFAEATAMERLTEAQRVLIARGAEAHEMVVPLIDVYARHEAWPARSTEVCLLMACASGDLRHMRHMALSGGAPAMTGPLLPQQSQQPQSPQQSQQLPHEPRPQSQRETAPQLDALPQLLRTAAAIAHALAFIADNGVVHYDLRCDNVLLVNDVPVLGDFGECHVFSSTSEQFESRGTECVKAPEMLLVSCGRGGGPLATGGAKAPLERCGTSSPCDVWSLGCLVFELLTGSFLYDEAVTSWPTFFTRITRHASDSLPLLPPDKSALLTRLYGEAAAKHVQEEVLLKLLVPNPDQRPSAALARSLLEAAAAALATGLRAP